jgi:hypothetical protein
MYVLCTVYADALPEMVWMFLDGWCVCKDAPTEATGRLLGQPREVVVETVNPLLERFSAKEFFCGAISDKPNLRLSAR